MFGYFRGMYYDMQTDAIICPDEMENFLLISETLFSENCFVYSDGERTYPGTIDLSKFTQENLDKSCYVNTNQKISITINGKTIGDQMYSTINITKPITTYNNGIFESTTMQIRVEEVVC